MSANIVILGLGATGLSCVEYFAAQNIPVTVVDSRINPPKLAECRALYPNVVIHTGGFPKAVLANAKTLILSPSLAVDHPDIVNALAPDAELIGEVEWFAKVVPKAASIVAITGSNGKSTVTTLVGEMAKAAGIRVGVGGNLGTPLLTLLLQNPDLYIIELCSFQLETTHSLKLKAATVLNISPDHLDRYPSLEAYKAAKLRIFHHCGHVIFNRHDPMIPEVKVKNLISFGLDKPAANQYGLLTTASQQVWLAKGQACLMPVSELKLFGRHNIANALAALALGDSIGLPMTAMLEVLKTFRGLPHRCEWIREYNDIVWINDSKGTNVGAALAAIEGLGPEIPGKWILIAGGVGKNADFAPLKPAVVKYCRAVILIGAAKAMLYELLEAVIPCISAGSMSDAVAKALQQAKPGDGVLLSPACASWDMFNNFEERGNAFKEAVKSL